MTRYDGIKKSIEVREQDVAEADRIATVYGVGPMAEHYRERARRCRADVEFLKGELAEAKAALTLVRGGKP